MVQVNEEVYEHVCVHIRRFVSEHLVNCFQRKFTKLFWYDSSGNKVDWKKMREEDIDRMWRVSMQSMKQYYVLFEFIEIGGDSS